MQIYTMSGQQARQIGQPKSRVGFGFMTLGGKPTSARVVDIGTGHTLCEGLGDPQVKDDKDMASGVLYGPLVLMESMGWYRVRGFFDQDLVEGPIAIDTGQKLVCIVDGTPYPLRVSHVIAAFWGYQIEIWDVTWMK